MAHAPQPFGEIGVLGLMEIWFCIREIWQIRK
jgi:hypothetical protein